MGVELGQKKLFSPPSASNYLFSDQKIYLKKIFQAPHPEDLMVVP